MRILLINPPYTRLKGLVERFFPMGLGYIGATLREAGHDVAIYNADNAALDEGVESWGAANRLRAFELYQRRLHNRDDPVWQEVQRVITDFAPEAIGIGCMTVTFESARHVARIARDVAPGVPLVWGGPHPTELPAEVVASPEVDFVVAGEGELAARDLFERLASGSQVFDDIAGIWFQREGQAVSNPPRKFIRHLDDLPFPDRRMMLNIHGYSRALMADFVGDIVSSRGCPHECGFCSVMNVWGRSVRWRSPENVLAEIEAVQRDYGTIEFHFWDDTFTINRRRTESMMRAIIERPVHITWSCLTRADVLDAELIALLKRAGCYHVALGLESGSDRLLVAMKKKITTADGRRAARLLSDGGLFWTALMMVGMPDETEEEIHLTWDYIKEIDPPAVAFSVFSPFPGTEMYAHARSLGLIDDSIDWSTVETKSPRNTFVSAIDPARFRALYGELAAWTDRWNQQHKPFWKGAAIRAHVYRRHPLLFLKRVYLALCRRLANRSVARTAKLEMDEAARLKPVG